MTGIPRYYVVRESLREEIRTRFKPGEKLPPEPELMKRFDVSRITIRHALEQLRAEGLITRVQGKGTFVSHPPVHPDFRVLRSFLDDIRASGQTPSTKVIRIESVPGPPRPCELLELPPKTPLVLIEKVRLADGTPISLEVSYLPEEIARGWNKPLLEQRPIFDLIREVSSVVLSRGKFEVSAAAATPVTAKALRIKKGQPLLRVERVNYNDQERPIDYDMIYYRADRVTYTFETSRRKADPGQTTEQIPRLILSGVTRVVN
jgi:GntR family transcriptional regulator